MTDDDPQHRGDTTPKQGPSTLTFGDRTFSMGAEETVLDCLERHDVAIPSSCRTGVCQSCVMQAVEGGVSEASREGLSEGWKARGLFMSCVCKPTGDLEIAFPKDAVQHTAAKLVHKEVRGRNVVILRFALEGSFEYRAGQFLHLVRHDGLTRPYSIANIPEDGYIELHIRKVEGGAMSTWAFDRMPIGERVELRGPLGECTYDVEQPDAPLVLFGTGTGLAPLIGVARDALNQGHRAAIHLFHAGRGPQDLYLDEELLALADEHEGFHYYAAVREDPPGPHAKVARLEAMASEELGSFDGHRVYLCGSPKMVAALKAFAYKEGARLEDLLTDAFVTAPKKTQGAKKRRLPVVREEPGAVTPRTWRQRLRASVQTVVVIGFILQGVLYYAADLRPLGGLLPFMAYDSLGHTIISSALLAWGAIFVLTLLFGRLACGWLCPFGAIQDFGHRVLRFFKLKPPEPMRQPRWVRWALLAMVLGRFVVLPLIHSSTHVWELDLHFREPWLLGFPFDVGLFVLDLTLVFIVIGIALPLAFGARPYCKLVCETGMLLDRTQQLSFGRIRRNHGFDRDTCISCERCSSICPQGIDVSKEVDLFDRVVSTDCIACLQCVDTCPNNTIVYSMRKKMRDAGKVRGFLASAGYRLEELPKRTLIGIGATSGGFIGFWVLPPSYIHTYLIFASLGGLCGWFVHLGISRLFPAWQPSALIESARSQRAREDEERILPLSMAERTAAAPARSGMSYLVPAAIVGALTIGLAAWVTMEEVPARISTADDVSPNVRTVTARAREGVVHFGIAPIMGRDNMHQRYLGLTRHLQQSLGRDVRLFSAPTYGELAQMVIDGTLDGALLPPLAYGLARRNVELATLLQVQTDGRPTYEAVLVSRSGEALSLGDVRGLRVAFTSHDSLSGYLAPTLALRELGIGTADLAERVFAGDHDGALRLLADGRVDVAATYEASFEAYLARQPDADFRIFHRTSAIPNDLLVTRADVDMELQGRLTNAFSSLHERGGEELTDALAGIGVEALGPVDDDTLSELERWLSHW